MLSFEMGQPGDEVHELVSIARPRRLRYSRADGEQLLLRGERGWSWRGEQGVRALAGAELDELLALYSLVMATYMQPLARAESTSRRGNTLLIESPDGSWELDLVLDGRDRPLPARMRGEAGELVFEDFVTVRDRSIPRTVRLGSLGARTLILRDAGSEPRQGLFELPRKDRTAVPDLVIGGQRRSKVPELQRLPGSRWVLVEDPGTWAGRKEQLGKLGHALYRAGQSNAGDPILLREGPRSLLAIPITPNPDQPELQQFAEGELRVQGQEMVAAVDAPADPAGYPARLRRSVAMLEGFIAKQGLDQAGSPRAIVNMIFKDFTDPDVAANAAFRVEIPVLK